MNQKNTKLMKGSFPNSYQKQSFISNSSRRYKFDKSEQQNYIPNLVIPISPVKINNRGRCPKIQHINQYDPIQYHNVLNSMNNSNNSKDSNVPSGIFAFSQHQIQQIDHIQILHQNIAKAREKKSQIQDLLRSEEHKFENQQLSVQQIQMGLRKLKKVVRLLQIITKLILGKEQNHQRRSYTQHQISLSSLYSQNIQNYQFQFKKKQKQIYQLNKMVDSLNIPAKESNISQNLMKSLVFQQQQIKQRQVGKVEIVKQGEQKVKNVPYQIPQEHSELSTPKRQLKIQHAFSVWNIIDGEDHAQQNQTKIIKQNIPIQKYTISTQTNKTRIPSIYLCSNLISISNSDYLKHQRTKQTQIYPAQQNFMRRYKSLVKLCLYSLNLSVGIILSEYKKYRKTSQIEAFFYDINMLNLISESVQKFSRQFNEKYYANSHQRYDDIFCFNVKQKLEKIYENIRNITFL